MRGAHKPSICIQRWYRAGGDSVDIGPFRVFWWYCVYECDLCVRVWKCCVLCPASVVRYPRDIDARVDDVRASAKRRVAREARAVRFSRVARARARRVTRRSPTPTVRARVMMMTTTMTARADVDARALALAADDVDASPPSRASRVVRRERSRSVREFEDEAPGDATAEKRVSAAADAAVGARRRWFATRSRRRRRLRKARARARWMDSLGSIERRR